MHDYKKPYTLQGFEPIISLHFTVFMHYAKALPR
jgi:hypothetical protein